MASNQKPEKYNSVCHTAPRDPLSTKEACTLLTSRRRAIIEALHDQSVRVVITYLHFLMHMIIQRLDATLHIKNRAAGWQQNSWPCRDLWPGIDHILYILKRQTDTDVNLMWTNCRRAVDDSCTLTLKTPITVKFTGLLSWHCHLPHANGSPYQPPTSVCKKHSAWQVQLPVRHFSPPARREWMRQTCRPRCHSNLKTKKKKTTEALGHVCAVQLSTWLQCVLLCYRP